jgi:two-component system, NarL family, invasion response regulator UvrY
MIRVLLADDHNIVRAGVKELLADAGDIVVAGEADNGNEALARVRAHEFDVAVLDMSMPGRSGIELIRLVKAERPKLKVLVLSMHSEQEYAVRALRAGASGYLTKESVAEELVAAIRRVAAGGAYVSPETAERLALDLDRGSDAPPHTRLSNREFEVFLMLAAGRSVTEIADALALSVKTISTHKTRIMQKMDLAHPAALIRYALEHHLLDSGEHQ